MNERPTHLDLFSGIGGFSFAFEAAGFRTVGFSEICPDASQVLAGHWPHVPNLGSIRELTGEIVRAKCGRVNVITAGVPCQPASALGQMRGTSDERWLWPDTIRLVGEVRPDFAVFENPPSILVLERGRAFNGITSSLAALGYDLFWDVIPAAALGAGHLRERLYIVAANSARGQDHGRERRILENQERSREGVNSTIGTGGENEPVTNPESITKRESPNQTHAVTGEGRARLEPGSGGSDKLDFASHPNSPRLEGHAGNEISNGGSEPGRSVTLEDLRHLRVWEENWWQTQSPVFPLVNGLPNKLVEAALRCVGNSIVPQVAQIYAETIYNQIKQQTEKTTSMITKVNAYQSSDGTAHSSLEEAQRHEVRNLIMDKVGWERGTDALNDATDFIIKNAETLVDILTTKLNSLTKARKVNGGTKRRKKGEQAPGWAVSAEPLPLVAAEEALRK